MKGRHTGGTVRGIKVVAAEDSAVEAIISSAADGMYSRILHKRIRTEVGGLIGGFIPRALLDTLDDVPVADLSAAVSNLIDENIGKQLTALDLSNLIYRIEQSLATQWSVAEDQRYIAPGEEILAAVYRYFGSRFEKSRDSDRIARAMSVNEISPEIVELIKKITSLAT